MSIPTAHLLKRLEPAVRPVANPAPHGAAPAPLEARPFGELLALATSGAMHSGRHVEIAAALDPPLEPAQIERLSEAADLAESFGAQRALLLIDGRGLLLDVAARSVEGELAAASEARVRSLDAAVYVSDPDAEWGRAPRPPLRPGAGVAAAGLPPSVARQLAEANHV